jgi:aspartate racemase
VAFQNGIRKIGLLGTQFTMEDGFYASRLNRQFGLEVLIPQELDRRLMDDIIYKELCLGKVSSSSKKEIIRMVQLLQLSGAEAILLGCTELGTLVSEKDLPIPVYDTTFLHVQAAVRMLLGKIEKTV